MRFGLEIVAKVRKAVGPDYPISMCLAGNEFMTGGNTNKEVRNALEAIKEVFLTGLRI